MTHHETKPIIQVNQWLLNPINEGKSVQQIMAEVREYGFDGIEMCFESPMFGPETSDADLMKINKAAI